MESDSIMKNQNIDDNVFLEAERRIEAAHKAARDKS